VRFERMRGRDVLWQPGTDHAGIATQMVVERQLMERQQPGRRDMGRQAFVERVWQWKAESGNIIVKQLKRLGASCDWSRERFTMDEGLSRAVLKVFVELHRAGLIYKDKRLVNWDPKLLTAISDLEVEQVEVHGHLWFIRYPVEGADRFITVATTRPETMLGDTAVAVHPDDERYRDLIGRSVILPLVGRRIPIIADEYSDPEKGSGAVKITPAHDFNDFEVGRRHQLPLINVLDVEAHLALRDNEAFLKGVPASADLDATLALHGTDRFAARKRIVERLEGQGLIEKVEPHLHMVPHGDRSNVVLEPFLTDQWYVDAKRLAQPAMAAVRHGRTVFVPKTWEKTYFDWMENIQPWCVSRQLWWGHQIPAWYGPDGHVFVALSEAEAHADATRHYGKPVTLARDEDVLDTWFSSALWPFSTLGWPDQTPELGRYYPTDVLSTAFDIIFFWVARMMMMGLHFMQEVPFHTVYIHALVRDEHGKKMSKTLGNVMDPLDIIDGTTLEALIEKRTSSLMSRTESTRIAKATRQQFPNGIEGYGADALRFTLAALAAQGRDISVSIGRVEGYRNFATKFWNAARFAEMNACITVEGFDPRRVTETLNRWIAHELAKTGREVTEAIETYRFNEAAGGIYRFVWNVFCDWYLELSKPVLAGPDGPAKVETRAMTAWVRDEILKLLHPFMPFITEELWRLTAEGASPRDCLLMLARWPAYDGLADDQAEAEIGWLVDLIRAIRSVRAEMNVPPGRHVPLVLSAPSPETRARAARWDEFLKRLARLSQVDFADEPPAGSIRIVVRGEVAALPVAGIVDVAAERTRLTRELAKLNSEIERVKAKLAKPDFVSRAPEEVVEGEREKLADAENRRDKIEEALRQLPDE
jgi:valyl-tRNA synthetase